MGMVVYLPAVAPPDAKAGSGAMPVEVAVQTAAAVPIRSKTARRDDDVVGTSKALHASRDNQSKDSLADVNFMMKYK